MNLHSIEQTNTRETSFISELDPYSESLLQFWPPEWEFPCMSSLEYSNNEQSSMPKGDGPTIPNNLSEQKNNIPCLGIQAEGHYPTDVQGMQQDVTYGRRPQMGAPLHISDMYLQHPSMCSAGVPCDAIPGGRAFMANRRLAWPQPQPQHKQTSGASTKPRLRWTPELHEMFVDAVKQLGGAREAKPREILKMMKIDGLTIFHVKSHLQKYRLTHALSETEMHTQQAESPDASPQPLDGLGATTSVAVTSEEGVRSETEGEGSITADKKRKSRGIGDSLDVEIMEHSKGRRQKLEEALVLQLRAQKQLQEQLESQRKLQRCIDAHARYISSLVKQEGLDEKYPELMATFAESSDLWESPTQEQKTETHAIEDRHLQGSEPKEDQTSPNLN